VGFEMVQGNFQLTGYDFYAKRHEMELITSIVEALKEIVEEDKQEKQPLFIKIADNFIMNIARKVVQDKKRTFLIGIAGESASGKTTFVDNTVKACVKDKIEGIYTVIRCDDYFYDTSKELKEAGNYEKLFKSGFSFDTPKVVNLDLMKKHLVDLKHGNAVISPKYDFVTCESFPDGEIKKPAQVLLTEGLYVLNEGLREIMDVKVYVFTPLDVLKDRWYRRAESRGKTGLAADMQFKDVNKTAQEYIRPTMEISDVIINGMVDIDYIEIITDRIFSTIDKIC
jgi:uridine kinase